jgi:hypothetical protein
MSYVNHDFVKGLVRRFQGSERTKRGRIYMMPAEEKEVDFW